jgi:hypothetical protein
MKGWVYIMTNEQWLGSVKIGFSMQDPRLRAKDFSTGSPSEYVVQYDVLVEEPRRIENAAHRLLAAKRVKREWFACDVAEAIKAVRTACQGFWIAEYVNPDADLAVRRALLADLTARRALKKRRLLLAAMILVVIAAGAFWVWNTTHQDRESIPSPPITPVIVTPKTPAPAPLPTPAVVTPKPTSRFFATEADARREALRSYPELGVADSRFNSAFLVQRNT